MRRIVATRTLGLGLGLATATAAVGLEGVPPLTPPARSEATGSEGLAPAELPGAFEIPPMLGEGPILAVPGLALPGGVGSTRPPPTPPDDLPGGLPPLVGPVEGLGGGTAPRTPWSSATNATGLDDSSRAPRTISLETIPLDDLDPLPDPATSSDPARRRVADLSTSRDSPPKRPRLFGLIPLPIPRPNARAEAARTAVPPRHLDNPRDAEPVSDPAADAALKRRVEQQIRAYAGEKLRSSDVRVVDREITIHAQAARFWQRRAVRRTLETLPALAGYRSHIELLD